MYHHTELQIPKKGVPLISDRNVIIGSDMAAPTSPPQVLYYRKGLA